MDPDSDGDGIDDSREGSGDADRDGIADFRDTPGKLETAVNGAGAFGCAMAAGTAWGRHDSLGMRRNGFAA